MSYRNKHFDDICMSSIDKALQETKENLFEYLCVDMVVLHILEDTETGKDFLSKMKLDINEIRFLVISHLEKFIPKNNNDNDYDIEITPSTHLLFQKAYTHRKSIDKAGKVTALDIVISSFSDQYSSYLYNYFLDKEITPNELKTYIDNLGEKSNQNLIKEKNEEKDKNKDTKKVSALDKYTVNLNDKVKEGKIEALIGRKSILESIVITIGQKNKNNPLIVGDAGVGKTAIVEGLAYCIVNNISLIEGKKIPDNIVNMKIHKVDMSLILAGSKYRGDFEEKLKSVLSEASKNKDIILFIDNIHTIINFGSSSGSLDAADIIKPSLESGEIKIIGCITNEEYRKKFEKEPSFSRLFKEIYVSPTTQNETFEIIKGLQNNLENYHNVKFTDQAINEVISLTEKYMKKENLPDKAIDMLDMSLSRANLFSKNIVDVKEIIEIISQKLNIPINSVGNKNETKKIKYLNTTLKSHVFGQEDAIQKITDSIILSRAQLVMKDKPICSFLLAGPTGVGKTEICKQLAKELNVPFIRFDMSEYMESNSVSRLIGASPGYIGHDSGGQLIEAINKNPNCVLLFDEIEKAHPSIYDILLQVMDYASLTDSQGRKADFKNVMFFMTSNLGHSNHNNSSLGFGAKNINLEDDKRLESIKKAFRLEFINRLDEVIIFKSLTKEIILKVVKSQISDIVKSISLKNISLKVQESAIQYIIENSFDLSMGARNVERFIANNLLKPLSYKILFESPKKKEQLVIFFDGKELQIKNEEIIDLPIIQPKKLNKPKKVAIKKTLKTVN